MNNVIMGLSHIGIKTIDSKKSIDFYKDILGFQHYYHVKRKSGMQLDFLRLSGCIVELIYSPDFVEHDMDKEGTVAHIALQVLDIEYLVASLKENGIDTWQSEYISEAPDIFPTGIKNIFFKGPSGELIEFVEHSIKQ